MICLCKDGTDSRNFLVFLSAMIQSDQEVHDQHLTEFTAIFCVAWRDNGLQNNLLKF